MWKAIVEPVACGLHSTGYAHKVVNGDRSITVTHHEHQNFDHIVTTPISRFYVQQYGVGRREPDLTPHPEAIAVAAALNNLAFPIGNRD